MSIARVTHVRKSIKPGKCEKCGVDLPPGSAYRWFKVGFRSHFKHVRCMNGACTPRLSELESSNLSEIYAAQETAHDVLDTLTAPEDHTGWESLSEDIRSLLDDLAGSARDLAQQYEEASTDQNGNVFNYTAEERAELLNTYADSLDAFEMEELSPDLLGEECDTCHGSGMVDGEVDNDIYSIGGVQPMTCPDCDGAGRTWERDFEDLWAEVKANVEDNIDSLEA